MKLSIALQTHPVRAELAAELAAAIGPDDYGATPELASDPLPDGPPAAWRTYRHALELTPADATHRLVIQDDAQVCRSFVPTIRKAIDGRPDRLISLFVGGMPRRAATAVLNACSRDESWAQLDNFPWCPAIALIWPVELLPELFTFVDAQNWTPRFQSDDEIIGRYLRTHKRWALATVPSLVEHPDDVPSLLSNRAAGGRDRARVAACFIDEECDPLTIDWA